MKRRDFVKKSLAAGTTVLAASTFGSMGAAAASTPSAKLASGGKHAFKLKYAPHFGMFKHLGGEDEIDQLKFAADQGFTAWEDNNMKGKPVKLQEKIAKTMQQLGMQMGVFVATASFNEVTFARKDQQIWDKVLTDIRESVDVARRVNAKWMTVVPGLFDQKLVWDYQTANCIELLKRCCEILEPHNLVMVMEPLNHHANHPGLFLYQSPQAYLICRAVNSPACKILFDIYHQQISEGNLIPNIDMCWDEIAYFQIGDNPGRKEPGTGEINYSNIFKHLYEKKFTGIMGMEHGNSRQGKEGEQAMIDAYIDADSF